MSTATSDLLCAALDRKGIKLELFEQVRIGRLKPAHLQEVLAEHTIPLLTDLRRRFIQGTLFRAQGQDFDSWLQCVGRHDDTMAYDDFCGMCFLCGQPVDQNVFKFASMRIFKPSPAQRKVALESAIIKPQVLDDWAKVNRFERWEWRAAA